MTEIWPWLVLVGLGMFHGLNPAMGWLFAVALGMHRQSRTVVLISLLPIALGHALAIGVVVFAVMVLGAAIPQSTFRIACAVVLIAWGAYHAFYGNRHRVRVGMTTGLMGLGLWSFFMATAHGAGLMLIPALMPLYETASHNHSMIGTGSIWISLAAVAVHSLAMLLTTGLISISVYEWLDLEFLRRGWVNLDVLWTIVLIATGLLLLFF